jgi:hypothetical protein
MTVTSAPTANAPTPTGTDQTIVEASFKRSICARCPPAQWADCARARHVGHFDERPASWARALAAMRLARSSIDQRSKTIAGSGFRLFALDAPLRLDSGATRRDVEQAIRGHVVARTELVGPYER